MFHLAIKQIAEIREIRRKDCGKRLILRVAAARPQGLPMACSYARMTIGKLPLAAATHRLS
jgi:hypothetical protein